MATVTLDLPEYLFALLRRSPGDVSREMRLAACIDWYRRGLITRERAAALAGHTSEAFLLELAVRGLEVPPDPPGPEPWT